MYLEVPFSFLFFFFFIRLGRRDSEHIFLKDKHMLLHELGQCSGEAAHASAIAIATHQVTPQLFRSLNLRESVLIHVLQINRANRYIMICRKRFNQLGWLWRLRGPTIYLPAGAEGPGKPAVSFQSKSTGPRTRGADIRRQEKMDVPEQAESKFALFPPFHFIQALNELSDVHLYW